MSRIRMIHPDFCDSVSLNNCSEGAQLLFVKTWTLADDEGRLLGDVPWLASRAYPHRTDAMMEIPMRLDELEREGLIQRYTVEDQEYLHVTNWKRRQRISHPCKSRLPAPPKFRKDSGIIPEEAGKSLQENEKDEVSGIIPEVFFEGGGVSEKLTEKEIDRALQLLLRDASLHRRHHVVLRALELMGRPLNMWQSAAPPAAPRPAAAPPSDTGQNDLEAARATQAALGEKSTG